jgi:hypothetical protein
MSTKHRISALLGPMAAGAALLLAGPSAGQPASPVVVELFQSQGCSSCPPANANLLTVTDRPDVLALSFGVTYWDELGWKDTFARPEFTARQWDYARAFHHREVYTPQLVINGRRDGVGAAPEDFRRLIAQGVRDPRGPALKVTGDRVSIGALRSASPADVWLVRYDPRLVQVPIRRGENGGKTLPHRNVVKSLTRLGEWSGAAETLRLPPSPDAALRTAILIQLRGGGPILAADRAS